MHARQKKLETMIYISVLAAVTLLLSYLPIKIGVIEMTLCMLPTVMGAVLLGPYGGMAVGFFFGLFSFFQCFGILGLPLSPFGAFLVSQSVWKTVVICFVARMAMGFLTGLLFRALRKKTGNVAVYAVANLSGALFNTMFFVGFVLLLFWHDNAFIDQMAAWNLPVDDLWLFITAFVAVNGVVEAVTCAVLGTAITKGVDTALRASVKSRGEKSE